jgi:hypothetical protein
MLTGYRERPGEGSRRAPCPLDSAAVLRLVNRYAAPNVNFRQIRNIPRATLSPSQLKSRRDMSQRFTTRRLLTPGTAIFDASARAGVRSSS